MKSLSPEERLHRIRHSLAHLTAQAVLEMRPGSKLGFGPAIDDGFYYDFILSSPLTEEDFPEIEKRVRKFISDGQAFVREDLPTEAALKRIDDMGEPYKKDYAAELIQKQGLNELSFYRSGEFLDMCEGPHVDTSRQIPPDCFKFRSLAGAYWRGDSNNTMMTRLYAWAFSNKDELQKRIKEHELALERDHKKLGKELDIFTIDEVIGKGLPLWLPNGTVIRDELQKLMNELEFQDGYQRVATPHLAKESLYHTTGHLPYYEEGMYPAMELREENEDGSGTHVKESYRLRPMNCPHHHRVFAARPRSYRDLPLRLAEYGQVYRMEASGALSGLLRVRGMCMNDAHIYCTPDQVKSEFVKVLDLHKRVYQILGIEKFHVRFSTWDPEDPKGKEKFVNNPEAWALTEKLVLSAIQESGLDWIEGKGEGAFYGPKADIQFRTVTGREETASTCQLDFAIPERMGLEYKTAENTMERPYIIHRAPLGTHERFVAFMIEHFGGAFPTWLAPVQVRIIPINAEVHAYGEKLCAALRANWIRAEVDATSETLNKRIRSGVTQKIPNLLVLGDREMQAEQVTLRQYGQKDQKTMPFAEFQAWIDAQIRNRSR